MRKTRILTAFLFSFYTGMYASAQDAQKDTTLGRQVYEMIESTMGIYDHPRVQAYVDAVGQRLVSHLAGPRFPFRFYLVDSPEPNAFAAPGGRIFLTRGMLSLPLREDELACIIAHEIIHTHNRHYLNRRRGGILGSIFALPGLILGGILPGKLGEAVSSPFINAGAMINAQYSQSDEREADREGVGLAAAAGYRPASLADILKRLERMQELRTGEREKKSYLSTHPYTPKRVTQIRQAAAKLPVNPAPLVSDPADFVSIFDGLPLGPNPEFGFIKDSTLYCAQFPLRVDSLPGWEYACTATAVGLVSPKQDALLILESGRDTLAAKIYLQRITEEIRRYSAIAPASSHEISWEGYPGGMIEYEIDSRGRTLQLRIFAIDYEGRLFRMIAGGYLDQIDEINRVLATVRPLKRLHFPAGEQVLLKVANAKAGETMETFSARVGSTGELTTNSLINDKSGAGTLSAGETIKFLLRTPYLFR